eukprot:jgi/Mesvir1/16642/Mv10177-RA.1
MHIVAISRWIGRIERFRAHYLDYYRLCADVDNLSVKDAKGAAGQQFAEALKADFARVKEFIERQITGCNDDLVRILLKLCNLAAEEPDESKQKAWLDRQEKYADFIGTELGDLDTFTQQNCHGYVVLAAKFQSKGGGEELPKWVYENVLLASATYCHNKLGGCTVGLSDIYELVRQARDKAAGGDGVWVPPEVFSRSTTKYWVPPENVVALKRYLMKYLPVLIFGRDRKGDLANVQEKGLLHLNDASMISSVYMDNPATLEMYEGRLRRDEGAQLFRTRWYGDQYSATSTTEVYLERKTHHEKWVGQDSVKERFVLQYKHVRPLLSGALAVDELVKWAVDEGKVKAAGVEKMEKLAKESVAEINRRSLAPVCIITYNRTAFQSDLSNEVRISLDTDLRMFSYSDAGAGDGAAFPYAILEVKLQGDGPPWLDGLLNGPFGVREVWKFSKFLSAIAFLQPAQVKLNPHYWNEIGAEWTVIKASSTGPGALTAHGPPEGTTPHSPDQAAVALPPADDPPKRPDVSLSDKKDDNKDKGSNAPRVHHTDASSSAAKDTAPPPAAKAHAVVDVPSKPATIPGDRPEGSSRGGSSKGGSFKFGSSWASLKRSKTAPGDMRQGGSRGTLWKRESSTANKPAIRPTRVEPKTFFANERTFIQWVSTAALLLTLSIALMDFGADGGTNVGYIMFPISLFLLVYALVTFLRRNRAINNKSGLGYADLKGPVVLTFALGGALIAAFVILVRNNIQADSGGMQRLGSGGGGGNSASALGSNELAVRHDPLQLPVLESEDSVGCLRVFHPPVNNHLQAQDLTVVNGFLYLGGVYQLGSVDLETPSFPQSFMAIPGVVVRGLSRSARSMVASTIHILAGTHADSKHSLMEFNVATNTVVRSLDIETVLPASATSLQCLSGARFFPWDACGSRSQKVGNKMDFWVLDQLTGHVYTLRVPTSSADNSVVEAVDFISGRFLLNGLSLTAISVRGMSYLASSDSLFILVEMQRAFYVRQWSLATSTVVGTWSIPGEKSVEWRGLLVENTSGSSNELLTVYLGLYGPGEVWRLSLNPAVGVQDCF